MTCMKALHFLRWPLILLQVGYLVFVLGSFSRNNHWSPAETFVSLGYALIDVAIVWIIVKFIFLKSPEDDSN